MYMYLSAEICKTTNYFIGLVTAIEKSAYETFFVKSPKGGRHFLMRETQKGYSCCTPY